MNQAEAKLELTKNIQDTTGTLDATADELLLRIAQFFGECVGDETFCGLSIDETRDKAGKITSLKLIPCDFVDNFPVRREGRFATNEPSLKLVQ